MCEKQISNSCPIALLACFILSPCLISQQLLNSLGPFFPLPLLQTLFIFPPWDGTFYQRKVNFFFSPFSYCQHPVSSSIDLCLSPKNVHFKRKGAFRILFIEVVHNPRRNKPHISFFSALKLIIQFLNINLSPVFFFFFLNNKHFLCVALYTTLMLFLVITM